MTARPPSSVGKDVVEPSLLGAALSSAANRLRTLPAAGRVGESVRQAEQDGLVFAFHARSVAIAIVSLWVTSLVPWPRNVYYLVFPFGFFVLGYVPFRLRHHRQADTFKFAFVALDVVLMTTAILVPPPAEIAIDWPVQTRMRGQVFLYLLLLLGEAALTYSPRRVLWTGLCIAVIWSAGCAVLYRLPDTVRYTDVVASGHASDADLLRMYVDPAYVSLPSWVIQLVATGILTLLLTLAVLRGRMHLLAEAKAEVVRSDLARYVSPDVAGAVESQDASGFGQPTTRNVAVLFADIVGFTGVTEHLPPERTFALLRSFQERSSTIVLRHRGTLDKYIGDGLMATFGALRDEPDAPARAVACAFSLQAEFDLWNAKRRARTAAPLTLAIGLHWGAVTVGNLGSTQRMEFTVVGDVVNVASRLEKATRTIGCGLLVSDACVRAAIASGPIGAFDRTLDVELRGRQTLLKVHAACHAEDRRPA